MKRLPFGGGIYNRDDIILSKALSMYFMEWYSERELVLYVVCALKYTSQLTMKLLYKFFIFYITYAPFTDSANRITSDM